MAVFSQITADKEVADYLYELNENLTYMFNNLTPEDNYSEQARLIYVERGEHIASLQVQTDRIDLRVANNETNYNTSITLLADLLSLTASTPEDTSSVELTGDKIELKTGKFIVNAKNLTIDALGNAVFSGKVTAAQIESSTITGGTISGTSMSASTITGGTINSTTLNSSTINSSSISAATISGGSITGTSISGGTLSGATITGNTISGGSISGVTITGNTISGGTIDGTTISGGTINGTTINGGTINAASINGGDDIRFKARPGYLKFGDFVVDDNYGRNLFMSDDECTGMSNYDASGDELYLWAGYDGHHYVFQVNANEEVRVRGEFYYNGDELTDLIQQMIDDAISNI